MFKTYKILAFIPARGGSKSIPKKNIALCGGKPLIFWTIDAAKRSKYIDRIVVSSDSLEIQKIGTQYGAEAIKRPKHLATDKAKPEQTLSHALNWLERRRFEPDIIIYLQPTSPLRNTEHIDKALEELIDKKAAALISVCDIEKKYLKTFIAGEQGRLKGAVNNNYPFMNRQELPDVYLPNGAIYIIYTKEFKRFGQLFVPNKTIPFIMNKDESIDIDRPEDLEIVSKIKTRQMSG